MAGDVPSVTNTRSGSVGAPRRAWESRAMASRRLRRPRLSV
jgi:hypothetical protein